MAIPSRELEKFRREFTKIVDSTNQISAALAIIEGVGADDAARIAFFTPFFEATPDYDVIASQFFDGIVKLRELEAWLKDPLNRVKLTNLRI
jgi:hypothetical protein